MKVILLQEVKKIGKKGDVLEVAEGFARNFLIPQKLATPATQANIAQISQQKAAEIEKQKRMIDEARVMAAQLSKLEVTVVVKAGEGGRMFGSVTGKDIADAIKEQHDIEIDRRKIEVKDTIKNVGTYAAIIKVHPDVNATIQIHVQGA